MDMKGRVLVVAGSDSGGGAGIQADIKTITALNGFAMTAITALTAQNSLGVKGVHKPPPAFVTDQIRVTLEDLGADAVKTGMMADAPIIKAAAEALEEHAGGVPWIVDPVMFSSARDLLLDEDAAEALKAADPTGAGRCGRRTSPWPRCWRSTGTVPGPACSPTEARCPIRVREDGEQSGWRTARFRASSTATIRTRPTTAWNCRRHWRCCNGWSSCPVIRISPCAPTANI